MFKEKHTHYLNLTICLMFIFCFAFVSAGFAAEASRVRWIDLKQMKKIIERRLCGLPLAWQRIICDYFSQNRVQVFGWQTMTTFNGIRKLVA